MTSPLVLGITLGDAGGIGPEVALKAAFGRPRPARCRLVLVGSPAAIAPVRRRLRVPAIPEWAPGGGPPRAPVSLWDPAPRLAPRPRPGACRADAARAAAAWIEAAAAACRAGFLDAMVTAPICKEGLRKAGLDVPGHTEMLAALTGTRRFAMMLIGGPLRVVLATRHLPLARVPAALTRRAIRECAELAWEALPWLGCPRGRLAVCGLNPHAGDGGAIGREELAVIAPEIRALRRRGIRAEGPVPADAVFHRAMQGGYAAVVAMYHDQGLGPLKTVAFETGINVTLGLPIVRTSPDHGTAFDIAGRGVADPRSMRAAIALAADLARRPNPWRRERPHGR